MLSVLLHLAQADAALRVPFTKRNAIYRRNTGSASLVGDGLGYTVSFKIGGQDMESIIDTGSSDLWIPESDGCEVGSGNIGQNADCQFTFNPSDSSSFSANQSQPFNITYGDGSASVGYYAQDTIEFASFTVSNANFALATQASTNSVFGIGLTTGEDSYYHDYAQTPSGAIVNHGGVRYDNFPWQLYRQGLISSAAYSLYLGNPVSYSGDLLFGGVDTSKFTGALYTMPIDLETIDFNSFGSALTYPEPTRFLVTIDSISMTNSKGKSQPIFDGGVSALLDSGSTISSFPSSIASALAAAFGVKSLDQVIGCGVEDGTVDITIRGETFHIPFSNFVRTLHNFDGDEVVSTDGTVACSPGIDVDDSSTFLIFGDNILSALYIVYDLSNNEISIAQANTSGDDDSNILEIHSNGVPSATQASGYSSTISYAISAVDDLDFRVHASEVTSISGDVATRTTFNGYEETSLVHTDSRMHLSTTLEGAGSNAGQTSGGSDGKGSSSHNGAKAVGASALFAGIFMLL